MATVAGASLDERWNTLYELKRVSVQGRVRRILQGSPSRNSNCEDACQDVWARLWKLGVRYWNPRGVNFVSRNVAIDYIRKDKTHQASQHVGLGEDAYDAFPDGDQMIQTRDISETGKLHCPRQEPEALALLVIPEISRRIALLPADQRAVFCFRYGLNGHEELSFEKIAQRLKMSTSATVQIFLQAKKNLRTMLGENNA